MGPEAGLGCEKLVLTEKKHTDTLTDDDVHTEQELRHFNQSGYGTLPSEDQSLQTGWTNTDASIDSDHKIQDPSLMRSSSLLVQERMNEMNLNTLKRVCLVWVLSERSRMGVRMDGTEQRGQNSTHKRFPKRTDTPLIKEEGRPNSKMAVGSR